MSQLKMSSNYSKGAHRTGSTGITFSKVSLGRGYGAFSVSESNLEAVAKYIADQEEHHRVRTFTGELTKFIKRHGLHRRLHESR